MDWFRRKNTTSPTPSSPPGNAHSPPNGTPTEKSDEVSSPEPTAEQRLKAFELEMQETIQEYVRKLESLATLLHEKSEENEQLVKKFEQRDIDMQVLLDKLVAQEKELETYKENQIEYKRRLEVLTDCLEDLARENMKLATKGVQVGNKPDDYEEERMPTPQEVQMQKTKSETALKSSLKTTVRMPTQEDSFEPIAPARQTHTETPSNAPPSAQSSSPITVMHTSGLSSTSSPTFSPKSVKTEPQEPEKKAKRLGAHPGLVLPSKSKSSRELRDPTASKNDTTPASVATPAQDGLRKENKHRRTPSNEPDVPGLSSDTESLKVILKKYKSQADSLRRDLIRERQKSESLQISIDEYEANTVKNDRSYRENLLKEARRRKDAEFVANVLKKRVTELQFLLDEKDDSDHDSDDDAEE